MGSVWPTATKRRDSTNAPTITSMSNVAGRPAFRVGVSAQHDRKSAQVASVMTHAHADGDRIDVWADRRLHTGGRMLTGQPATGSRGHRGSHRGRWTVPPPSQ